MTEVPKPKDAQLTSEDYEQLLDQYQFSAKEVGPGKIVKGRVIKLTPTHVLVDIGMKSEGVIPVEDYTEAVDSRLPKAGDEVEARGVGAFLRPPDL